MRTIQSEPCELRSRCSAARPRTRVNSEGSRSASALTRATSSLVRAAETRRVELVTVFGPPGIGKTRLTGELGTIVEQSDGRVLRGRSLPYGQTSGYGAFAQQLSHLAGIFETVPVPLARQKLDRAVTARLSEGGEEVTAHLAALTGLEDMGAVE